MEANLMNTEVDTESDVIGLDGYEDTSSEENPLVAETEGAEDSVDAGSNTEESTQSEVDVNAIAAAARRKAESEMQNRLNEIDKRYAEKFANYKNPITGKPIRSEKDYWEALDAQDKLARDNELKSKGIDPSIIDDAVANNPMVKQAQLVLEQNKQQALVNQINSDIAELGKIDPSIKSLENVPPDVIKMSMDSDGAISLTNAYKILNYGKVSESKQAAITQNAINQAKGKQHLTPVNGVATPDEGVEIPNSEMAMWKEVFPDKTNAELKKLYNDSL